MKRSRLDARAARRTLARCALALALLFGPDRAASIEETPTLGDGPVETAPRAGEDARIAERLGELYASLDALREVEVSVEAGVVRLRGVVPSVEARETALQLARRVDGVAAVESELREDRSVRARIAHATGRLADRALDLLAGGPILAVALALAALVYGVGRWIARRDAPFARVAPNPFLRDLARQAVRLAFALAAVLVALEVLDATALLGAVLGAAGVASLALGFAFRDLIENYIASILLSLRQPFLPNDHVRIGEHEGLVARLTSRATLLLTLDGNHVRIPNGVVFKGVIENFTRKPERRLSFALGVGVDQDLVAAQDLAGRVLEAMPGVLSEPPPQVAVEELGDSNVVLRAYAWVDQRKADFLKVQSEAIRLVKEAFDRERIEMPEPIHRIRLHDADREPRVPDRAPTRTPSDPARDVSREEHLEDELARERRIEGEDLLDETAPRE